MTKVQQKRFVKELAQSVLKDVNEAIKTGKVPAEWDGIELREFMYEKFLRARANHVMEGKRGREYRNTVVVNNL